MNPVNIALALEALLRLVTSAEKIAKLITAARAEGRDITQEELKMLAYQDDAARGELEAAIARVEQNG